MEFCARTFHATSSPPPITAPILPVKSMISVLTFICFTEQHRNYTTLDKSLMQAYIYLAIAILAETGATLLLPITKEFSKPVPSILVIAGYGLAFYFMTLSLRSIPIGITYAIWSGIGMVMITTFAYVLYQQKQDLPAMIGIGLIIAGVLVINLFSKTASHS